MAWATGQCLPRVSLEPDPTIAMFLNRVEGTGKIGEFVNLGPALAEVTLDDSGLPQLKRVTDIGPDDPSRTQISWGAASWAADDGYVYIGGTSKPEDDLVFGWALHVGRAKAGQIFDVESWEYWDGDGWTGSPADSAVLIPAVGGVSQTLSLFAQGDRWYAVSKQDDFLGEDVDIWMAPSPTGPFEIVEIAAKMPSDLEAGVLKYIALAHPTLFPVQGTIVLSISNNTTDFTELASDPSLYRPEFFRANLPS